LTLIEDSLMREEILDIHTLKRRGYSDRKIARELGIHRNTVRKYLENPDRFVINIIVSVNWSHYTGILDRMLHLGNGTH